MSWTTNGDISVFPAAGSGVLDLNCPARPSRVQVPNICSEKSAQGGGSCFNFQWVPLWENPAACEILCVRTCSNPDQPCLPCDIVNFRPCASEVQLKKQMAECRKRYFCRVWDLLFSYLFPDPVAQDQPAEPGDRLPQTSGLKPPEEKADSIQQLESVAEIDIQQTQEQSDTVAEIDNQQTQKAPPAKVVLSSPPSGRSKSRRLAAKPAQSRLPIRARLFDTPSKLQKSWPSSKFKNYRRQVGPIRWGIWDPPTLSGAPLPTPGDK